MSGEKAKIVIITGLSGSGKSTALAALEDAGYFCVDNLPVLLLPRFLDLYRRAGSGKMRFAFVMDLREGKFLSRYESIFRQVEERGFDLEIIFLEASEDSLLRRYSVTRRPHPLAGDLGLQDGIREEKKQLLNLRGIAGQVLDTSRASVHQLKQMILDRVGKNFASKPMRINVVSFGFANGLPPEADLVMDVRFLPNPHFVPELKEKTGEDGPVRDFVLEKENTKEFLQSFLNLLDFLVPQYEQEGKSYLTLAVGCTGGRHRSVAVAGAVSAHLKSRGKKAVLTHRELTPAHAC